MGTRKCLYSGNITYTHLKRNMILFIFVLESWAWRNSIRAGELSLCGGSVTVG